MCLKAPRGAFYSFNFETETRFRTKKNCSETNDSSELIIIRKYMLKLGGNGEDKGRELATFK
jgi:hypothetical protein